MKTKCAELRSRAWNSLKGKYWYSVLACLVANVMSATCILTGAAQHGQAEYFIGITRKNEAKFESLMVGFNRFVSNFVLSLLLAVFIVLWSLLLVVPGIIKEYAYGLSYHIVADNPDINPSDAIAESRRLMKGYKGKAFLLDLSFIGWGILSCILPGIGLLLLLPYMEATKAQFYEEILRLHADNPVEEINS